MILHNPTGRPVRLEIPISDDGSMALTIGAHASVDLDRYQRALDALAAAEPPYLGIGSVLASKENGHDTDSAG
jgi:hypothetical protein